MAASTKYRFKHGPLDTWSVRERLALASAVRRSGDQNWVSVSRAIKPYGEANRPPDWFSQKNCALQYADMLEKAETPKRKRGEKGEVIETPANQIMRKLTIERIEELKRMVQEEQQKYKKFKWEVESIKAGQCDDKLTDMWEKILAEKTAREEKQREEEKKAAQEAMERAQAQALRRAQTQPLQRAASSVSTLSEMDESTQDSLPETLNVETTDDEMPATPTPIRPITIEIPLPVSQESLKHKTPTSPLLSSLLQSKQISVDSLQQIKAEAEANYANQQAAADKEASLREVSSNLEPIKVLPGRQQIEHNLFPAPSLNTLLGTTADLQTKDQSEVTIVTTHVPEVKHEVDVVTTEEVIDIDGTQVKAEDIECETIEVETIEEIAETIEVHDLKQPVHEIEVKTEVEIETTTTIDTKDNTSLVPVEEEPLVKEEPLSPASSVSSRISEAGSRASSVKKYKAKPVSAARKEGARVARRSLATDDEKKDELSFRPSDVETSDDDGDSSVLALSNIGVSAFSESIPSSPLSHCSDTEDDKAYKIWKKSIMLVWRAAANHKYANVFLHPVTNDIAPGYTTVVRRPKDLSTIKRHIENGTIRTTVEFQRDMMLMFTNAVMYNSSNHDVYKMAVEMYDDVMQHIEQYVSTQLMVQNTEVKLLRPTRRNESSDKEDESRRRRTSSEAEGGKTKKRKSRADDT